MSLDVLVVGRLKTGKSTFINALIGESILPARARQCTALVTEIEFGNDTEHIKVFYKGSDIPVIEQKERYVKNFIYPDEDTDWELTDKWKDVLSAQCRISHIEMQTKNDFFPGGFKIIDTPGKLDEPYYYYYDVTAYVTDEYVPKANAIIFMMDATALFSSEEKKYIGENFAGKHLRNVFFVVNRINQVTEPLEENVKPAVKSGLSSVFTDASGRFDEDLFQKRVFYVNAYGARCARTGEPYKVWFVRKEIEIPIEIEETGFPEFESALWRYLRSSIGYSCS